MLRRCRLRLSICLQLLPGLHKTILTGDFVAGSTPLASLFGDFGCLAKERQVAGKDNCDAE